MEIRQEEHRESQAEPPPVDRTATRTPGESRFPWLVQTLELLALAIWIGGLIVIIGAVIPAVFNTFGGQMEAAGHFLRRVFDGYNRLVAGCIFILLAGMVVRWWVVRSPGGHAQASGRTELFVLAGMIVVASVIMFVAGPHALALQEQAFAAQGEAARKEAYEVFFRSHLVVRTLYLVNLVLGIGLMAVKVKRYGSHPRSALSNRSTLRAEV